MAAWPCSRDALWPGKGAAAGSDEALVRASRLLQQGKEALGRLLGKADGMEFHAVASTINRLSRAALSGDRMRFLVAVASSTAPE